MEREALGGFAVKRGEVGERLDPHFYFAEFVDAIARVKAAGQFRNLGATVSLSAEALDPKSFGVDTFRYIEIGGMGIGSDSYEVTELPTAAAPSRARMVARNGDILLSTTRPDRGAIARVKPADDQSIASTGFAVLRAPVDMTRDALFEVLQTDVVKLQLRQRSSGGAYPAITADELKQIVVPLLIGDKAAALLANLDAARTARGAGLAAADAALDGLDAFILDELGIALLPPETVLPFAIRLSDATHSRVDTEYHSPRFRRLRATIENGPFDAMSIADLCLPLITGFAAGGGDQSDAAEGVPHLRPTNVTTGGEITLTGSKYVPMSDVTAEDGIKPGEVLFNNTNSSLWVGKSAVFDLVGLCACSNHMTRLRFRNARNSPIYLAALLNALRSIGYFSALATNFNNQAGINSDGLGALRIPVPPPGIQTTIAAEVDRRRAEARRLRAEARAGWAAARQVFEDALLGPAA